MIELKVIDIKKPEEFSAVKKLRMPLERVIIIFSLDPDIYYSAVNIADAYYERGTAEHTAARKAFNKIAMYGSLSDSFDNVNKKDIEQLRWFGCNWVWTLGDDYACYAYRFMEEFKERVKADPGPYFLEGNKILTEKDLLKRPKKKLRRKPAGPKKKILEGNSFSSVIEPEKLDKDSHLQEERGNTWAGLGAIHSGSQAKPKFLKKVLQETSHRIKTCVRMASFGAFLLAVILFLDYSCWKKERLTIDGPVCQPADFFEN